MTYYAPRALSRALAILASAATLVFVVSSADAATVHHCGMIGPAQSDVGLYNITAKRLSCRKTRRVLTRWYNDASAPDAGPRGWKCRTRQTGSFSFRTACRHGHFRIAWTQYSA
jgi:hypothetical protein